MRFPTEEDLKYYEEKNQKFRIFCIKVMCIGTGIACITFIVKFGSILYNHQIVTSDYYFYPLGFLFNLFLFYKFLKLPL